MGLIVLAAKMRKSHKIKKISELVWATLRLGVVDIGGYSAAMTAKQPTKKTAKVTMAWRIG